MDAALGVAFQELFTAVKFVVVRAAKFKSILKEIEFTLNRITPMIEDIEQLSRKLDISQEDMEMFTSRLIEAREVVVKCRKVQWWHFCARPYYAQKLMELQDSLLKFFQIEAQGDMWRDSKKSLVILHEISSKLDRTGTMGGMGGANRFPGRCGVPGARGFVFGFKEPLQVLKARLLKDEEQLVVLSGPGGCGKTTLAKLLCQDDEIKDKFKDNMFFFPFSKKPNPEDIVGKLLQHMDGQVPNFPTEEDAFNQLEYMLVEKGSDPILLVLDDVWPGSEDHIERFKFRIPNYQILVTSRSVFPVFSTSTYRLELLKHKDARDLFHRWAFPNGDSSIPIDLVNKIVRGCGGLPLALEVFGGSLCGQPEVTWKRTVEQWSKEKSALPPYEKLLNLLKTSFDALDNLYKIKDCYQDLASFPEDQRISVAALIDMWVELYNLKEDGEDAMANLHELSNRNMVNLLFPRKDASDTGYYNEHFVTQHDLLRELAMYVNEQSERLIMDMRSDDLPASWIEQRQHPVHARLVSISTGENFSNCYDLQLPKAEVLVLNIHARGSLPQFPLPPFVEKMDQLKKLSLVMCRIDEAFRSYGFQIPDPWPNLAEIIIDYCSDLVEFPAWLCNVISLRKLSITNCHELIALPEVLGKLENLEVLRLEACTKLMKLPQSIGSLKRLEFLDLTDCMSLCEVPERVGELCSLGKIHMRGCRGLSELPPSVKDLTHLKDLICDEETSYLWEHHQSGVKGA
ncbi:probable disease resistance protein At5g66900 [Diospyros lotus]|uniref:probable disease resistance protein At5g66900 n=1 Tax=Diospyros lotus TaxID=55363 RepID=UPI00224D822B|nr:probable disease resistance protein At5g66900 [Diospyros lotus]